MTDALIKLAVSFTLLVTGLSVFFPLPGLRFLYRYFEKRRLSKKEAGKRFFAFRQRLAWGLVTMMSLFMTSYTATVELPNASEGSRYGVTSEEYASLKVHAPKDDFDGFVSAYLKAKSDGVKSVYEFSDMKKRNMSSVEDYYKIRNKELNERLEVERQAKAAEDARRAALKAEEDARKVAEEARRKDEKIAEDAKKVGLSVEAYKAKLLKDEEDREAQRRQALAIDNCKKDWRQCADNSMLINNFQGMPKAKAACQIAAEKLAKFGDPQWDWAKFGTYFEGSNYISKGVIRIQDPNVKFQNGFGAWRRTTIECFYDLKTETVDLVHSIE